MDSPPLPVTTAELAAMDPDDFPDVTVIVTDEDDGTLYDSRGADGVRAWVKLAAGPAHDHDAAYSAVGHTHARTTVVVPIASGDPDNPGYLFGPRGHGLFVEVEL